MTKSPFDRFERQIREILLARAEILSKIRGATAAKLAQEYAIQGLYLVAVRSFEAFLEEQVLELACGRATWTSRIHNSKRARFSRRLREDRAEFLREIILAGKDYTDYLPYEKTIEISKRLFVGGRPFSLLGETDRNTLRRCLKVRHFIAHESGHAREGFYRSIQAVKPFRMKHPRPIHYLQENIRRGVTFFEHDVARLTAIARFLS